MVLRDTKLKSSDSPGILDRLSAKSLNPSKLLKQNKCQFPKKNYLFVKTTIFIDNELFHPSAARRRQTR
jgi:hypothetical protein